MPLVLTSRIGHSGAAPVAMEGSSLSNPGASPDNMESIASYGEGGIAQRTHGHSPRTLFRTKKELLILTGAALCSTGVTGSVTSTWYCRLPPHQAYARARQLWKFIASSADRVQWSNHIRQNSNHTPLSCQDTHNGIILPPRVTSGAGPPAVVTTKATLRLQTLLAKGVLPTNRAFRLGFRILDLGPWTLDSGGCFLHLSTVVASATRARTHAWP
jgi:hypothetical protein